MNQKKKHRRGAERLLEERKASSLTPREELEPVRASAHGSEGGREPLKDLRLKGTRRRTRVWVDILLLLLLIAAITGGVFGYRLLQRIYAPKGEDREVILTVELARVDAEILPKYWVINGTVLLTDREGNVGGGTLYTPPIAYESVTDATVPSENTTYKAFTIGVRATAFYREGRGYFLGDVPLLAGESYAIRLNGISTECMITAVYESAEYEAHLAEQTSETDP